MGKKEWDLPIDCKILFEEADSLLDLMESCIKIPFAYKKAKKAALERKKIQNKAWKMIRELYPETSGISLRIDPDENKIKQLKE